MVAVSDLHDPDDEGEFDPLHGVPREKLDAAHEAAIKLGENAHSIGLHMQHSDLAVSDGQDGERQVLVAGTFLIGALAWSDRVQDPQAEAARDVIGQAETEIMRDKAQALRERMAKKDQPDDDTG